MDSQNRNESPKASQQPQFPQLVAKRPAFSPNVIENRFGFANYDWAPGTVRLTITRECIAAVPGFTFRKMGASPVVRHESPDVDVVISRLMGPTASCMIVLRDGDHILLAGLLLVDAQEMKDALASSGYLARVHRANWIEWQFPPARVAMVRSRGWV